MGMGEKTEEEKRKSWEKRHRNNFVVDFCEVLETGEKLGMNGKELASACGLSYKHFNTLKKKGAMPLEYFWALQNQLTIYATKEFLKTLFSLKVIDKEFLAELLEIKIEGVDGI